MTKPKVKIATDLPPPKKLSKEEAEKLMKEGRKAADAIFNPPPPGDYELGFNTRGKKTTAKCSACKGQIEIVYTVQYPPGPPVYGPGGKGHWAASRRRCSDCKLLYDF